MKLIISNCTHEVYGYEIKPGTIFKLASALECFESIRICTIPCHASRLSGYSLHLSNGVPNDIEPDMKYVTYELESLTLKRI